VQSSLLFTVVFFRAPFNPKNVPLRVLAPSFHDLGIARYSQDKQDNGGAAQSLFSEEVLLQGSLFRLLNVSRGLFSCATFALPY
jgi:hypothetical protein